MLTKAIIIDKGLSSTDTQCTALQNLGSTSVVHRIIKTFSMAGVEQISLIIDKIYENEIVKLSKKFNMDIVFFDDENHLQNIIQRILQSNDRTDKKIILTTTLTPLFNCNTVKTLLNSDEYVNVPVYNNRTGNLILFNMRADECNYLNIKINFDDAIISVSFSDKDKYAVTYINVSDDGIFTLWNSKDTNALIYNHTIDTWRPVARVMVACDSLFWGPGTLKLLSLIRNTNSMRLSCENMGLSYSKSWKMINNLESEVGFPVVSRIRGGKDGGNTHLTPLGEKLLNEMIAFEEECKEEVRKIFNKHFITK